MVSILVFPSLGSLCNVAPHVPQICACYAYWNLENVFVASKDVRWKFWLEVRNTSISIIVIMVALKSKVIKIMVSRRGNSFVIDCLKAVQIFTRIGRLLLSENFNHVRYPCNATRLDHNLNNYELIYGCAWKSLAPGWHYLPFMCEGWRLTS